MNVTAFIASAIGLVCLAVLRLLYVRAARERTRRAAAEGALGRATAVAELNAALSRAKMPAEVVHEAVTELVHAFAAAAGAAFLLAENGSDLTLADAVGYPQPPGDSDVRRTLDSRTPLTDAIRRHELVGIRSRAALAADYPDAARDTVLAAFEAAAVIPLHLGERPVGAIAVGFERAPDLSGDDHAVMLAAGRHIAQALTRARLYERADRARADAEDFRTRADAELRERQRAEEALRESEGKYRALAARSTRLYELSAALSEAMTLESVARVIVRQGRAVVGASAGSVAIIVDGGRQFETLYAEGYSRLLVEAWPRFTAERGLCATTAAERRTPVYVASLSDWQKHYPRSGALAADAGFESSAAMPLLSEGAAIGVLTFHFAAPVSFNDEYVALLRSVVSHCAQALDRARLYEAAQRARADAEEANRAKDDFLSILSHELRTPLNAMLGWASLLRGGALEPGRQARAVEAIFSNASRQAKLIEDLLDVSRIIAGRTSLDIQEFELAECLRGAADAVMPQAEAKGVSLRIEALPSVTVAADPRRLEQVFLNLMSNAVKFTPAGGTITIGAALRNGSADVRVADTGAGIDAEFLPHVFERFRQGDATRSRRAGGLGLGLFIARHLVEAQGGAITAASEGADRGSTFTVTLPIAGTDARAAQGRPAAAAAGDTPAPRLAGIRVLLVDDEPDTLEVMTSMLESCGAKVTAAASARQAIASLSAGQFDVLLSDIAMPDADGYALIRTVRSQLPEQAAHIPAAAVTACASDDDRQRALAAGFQTHLTKPVASSVLAETVASLVQLQV